MQLRKAIKKIAAVGTGVTLMGATLMGAMAADLNEYPAPFVKDGMFDALIVVGDNAKASDVIGSVDIATSLQFSMKQTTTISSTGGSSQVAVSGDAVEVGLPNDLLEVNEFLGDVRETVTEVDLEALRGGLISTAEGTTDYNQYIRFNQTGENIASGRVVFDEDDNDNVGDFLKFEKGDIMFQYELEFEEGLESDLKNVDADSALEAEDLHDEAIEILGQTFSIVNSDVGTSDSSITLELISGEVLDTMEEGETKTYTIDGIDYEVEVIVISDFANNNEGSVKFRINDEITDELADGETDLLQDGLEIGIRDVIPNEAGDITPDLVEFYLGANKLKFTDTNYTDDNFYQGVEINEENIEDARVKILAENGSREFEISSIEYRLFADSPEGTIYIPPGHGLREYIDEPQGMISPSWDIRYEGLADTGVSLVKYDAAGDDEYNLKFTNVEGQNYDIPLADNSDSGNRGFNFGNDDDDLIICEATPGASNITGPTLGNVTGPFIDEDDYFVLTDEPFDETAFTHVLRFESIDVENKELKFTDLGTGLREITFKTSGTHVGGHVFGQGTLTVGGNSFTVLVMNETTDASNNLTATVPGDAQLAIDLNNDGLFNTTAGVPIVVQGGGILTFPGIDCTNNTIINGSSTNGALLTQLTTLSSEFDEPATSGDEVVNITIVSRSNDEVGLETPTTIDAEISSNKFFHSLEENDDIRQGLTNYGIFFELFDESGDQEAEELTFEYPLAQRGAQVFVTAGKISTTTIGAGGAIETVTLEAIEIGSAVLASEVTDVAAQNLVMVGGPCANEAARRVMGVDMADCAAGFTPGKAIMKLYETGLGNVALLVAGDQPMDTRAAARVLANYDSYDLSGDEISITYTSLSDITVSEVV